MPSIDLFAARDESQIRDVLQLAEANRLGVSYPEYYQLAVDYLEGRQIDDVDAELSSRYERTQTGDRGGQIAAQTIPLTQRYVDEAATAYSRPVTRKLFKEDGTTDEPNTEALNRFLSDSGYDDSMGRLEQYTVLLKSAGLWFQARGGEMRTEVVWPHRLYPALPDDDWASISDQADYAGFAVEMHQAATGTGAQNVKRYAWSEPAQVAFYTGVSPYRPDSNGLTRYASSFVWPQSYDGKGMSGETADLPLQMIAIASDRKPVGELVIDSDPMVVLANRELNLQLSILLDTLAHQAWSTMLLSLLNPDSPPATFSAGPRNGLVLGAGESANMLSSPVNYTDLSNVLQTWVRLLAMAQSQSPNDFSAQAQAATSGFAKLVDSLPKIESRKKRLARWRRFEANLAWPRIAVIGDALKVLTGGIAYLATLRHSVDYQPLEFPESVPERVQRETHEVSLGLTTPAKILAKQTGISLEQAEEEVAKNKGQTKAQGDDTETEQNAENNVVDTPMEGANVATLRDIVTSTAKGEMPRDSAIAIVEVAFGLTADEARRIIGEAGLKVPEKSDKAEMTGQQNAGPVSPPPQPGGSKGERDGETDDERGPPTRARTPGEAIGQLIRGRR